MIVVQDRIDVPAQQLARLQQLFHERYIEDAARRGLHFIEFLVAPPLQLQAAPVTLWVRWQVADAGAWWAMRAQSGTPAVAEFWDEVDSLCLSRRRDYLGDAAPDQLPQAEDISAFSTRPRGHRETAQLALRDGADTQGRAELESALHRAAAELPGLQAASLGANFAPEYAAGHYSWDLLYPDRYTAETARKSPAWQTLVAPALQRFCSECHALQLVDVAAGGRQPGLTQGIKRTAFFRMLPGSTIETMQRFEQDLLEMPAQIPQILNWRLSRAQALPWHDAQCAPWTHVWEQEFATLDDLLGPYMLHPHHWAHIDRWFDPESGAQAVDVRLSHAFCAIGQSVLGRESTAGTTEAGEGEL